MLSAVPYPDVVDFAAQPLQAMLRAAALEINSHAVHLGLAALAVTLSATV